MIEVIGSEQGMLWIVLGVIALILMIAVAVSLFRLYQDIEEIDRTYNSEDDDCLPHRP